MSNTIQVQFQDIGRNWVTVQANVQNQSQMIMTRMREVQRMYPDKRVRAIDESGRLVDML